MPQNVRTATNVKFDVVVMGWLTARSTGSSMGFDELRRRLNTAGLHIVPEGVIHTDGGDWRLWEEGDDPETAYMVALTLAD